MISTLGQPVRMPSSGHTLFLDMQALLGNRKHKDAANWNAVEKINTKLESFENI